MRYQIKHALVQYAANTILEDVNFEIHDNEKIAVVGRNGCGKTTLLRILMGEMSPDEGTVVLAKDKVVGYLAQNSTVDSQLTIYEELLSVKQELINLEEKMRVIYSGICDIVQLLETNNDAKTFGE